MQTILNCEPQKVCEISLVKWRTLEPLKLDELIKEHKIEFNENAPIRTYIKYHDFNYDYYG